MIAASVKYIVIGLTVVAILGSAYALGKRGGRVEQLEDIVEAERERRDIDDNIQTLSDYDLCLRLVRMPEQCQQLRRVAPTASRE